MFMVYDAWVASDRSNLLAKEKRRGGKGEKGGIGRLNIEDEKGWQGRKKEKEMLLQVPVSVGLRKCQNKGVAILASSLPQIPGAPQSVLASFFWSF